MFNEANVTIGNNYEIELSHHYDMEKFEKVGALLITIINRDYCKKLIAQLPGQSHPSHYHEKKEETFHILSGSMTVKRNDETFNLKKGDTLLFGRESAGVPDKVHKMLDLKLKIPMENKFRSLNLSTSVSIVLSENLRQTKYL